MLWIFTPRRFSSKCGHVLAGEVWGFTGPCSAPFGAEVKPAAVWLLGAVCCLGFQWVIAGDSGAPRFPQLPRRFASRGCANGLGCGGLSHRLSLGLPWGYFTSLCCRCCLWGVWFYNFCCSVFMGASGLGKVKKLCRHLPSSQIFSKSVRESPPFLSLLFWSTCSHTWLAQKWVVFHLLRCVQFFTYSGDRFFIRWMFCKYFLLVYSFFWSTLCCEVYWCGFMSCGSITLIVSFMNIQLTYSFLDGHIRVVSSFWLLSRCHY